MSNKKIEKNSLVFFGMLIIFCIIIIVIFWFFFKKESVEKTQTNTNFDINSIVNNKENTDNILNQGKLLLTNQNKLFKTTGIVERIDMENTNFIINNEGLEITIKYDDNTIFTKELNTNADENDILSTIESAMDSTDSSINDLKTDDYVTISSIEDPKDQQKITAYKIKISN